MSLWQEIATFSKSHERKARKVDRFWRWSVYMSRVFFFFFVYLCWLINQIIVFF